MIHALTSLCYLPLPPPGVDELLARHVAHLFIRDPVSLFSEKIHQDDENDTDHFEVMPITLIDINEIRKHCKLEITVHIRAFNWNH